MPKKNNKQLQLNYDELINEFELLREDYLDKAQENDQLKKDIKRLIILSIKNDITLPTDIVNHYIKHFLDIDDDLELPF